MDEKVISNDTKLLNSLVKENAPSTLQQTIPFKRNNLYQIS